MEINIEKDEVKNDSFSKNRYKNSGFAIGVLWRIVIVCLIIDIPIWAYFHFVKGVTVIEGIRQIRKEVELKNKQENSKEIIVTSKVSNEILEKESRMAAKVAREIHLQRIEEEKKQKFVVPRKDSKPIPVYSWTNEKGHRTFSNIGFPEDGKYRDGKIEWH